VFRGLTEHHFPFYCFVIICETNWIHPLNYKERNKGGERNTGTNATNLTLEIYSWLFYFERNNKGGERNTGTNATNLTLEIYSWLFYFERNKGGLCGLEEQYTLPWYDKHRTKCSRSRDLYIIYIYRLYFSALDDVCSVSRSEGMLEFWQHLEHKLWFCLGNIFGRESNQNEITRYKKHSWTAERERKYVNYIPYILCGPFWHRMTYVQVTLAPFHFIQQVRKVWADGNKVLPWLSGNKKEERTD